MSQQDRISAIRTRGDLCRRAIAAGTLLACCTAAAHAAGAPVLFPEQVLQPSQQAAFASAAIDGDIIVLGAPGDDGAGTDSGAVYVFERPPSGTWVQAARLESSTAAPCERFGADVDVKGGTLVATHWDTPLGCSPASKLAGVHAFERDGPGWSQTLNLSPVTGQELGLYIAFDGTSLVNAFEYQQAFAISRDPGGSWESPVGLSPSVDNTDSDWESRGLQVAINEGLAAIGGVYRDTFRQEVLPAASLIRRDLNGQWQDRGELRVDWEPGRGGEVSIPKVRVSVGPGALVAVNEFIFEMDGSGFYHETERLRPPCTSASALVDVKFDAAGDLALVRTRPAGEAVAPSLWNRGVTLHLYRKEGWALWSMVAQLIPQQHAPVSGPFAIDSGIAVSDTSVWDTAGTTSTSYQFSTTDPCAGHRGHWVELTPSRWDTSGGVYRINTTDYVNQSGDRPGEYALLSHHRFRDFDFSMKARTDEVLGPYTAADYVVIFAYRNEANYYYMMFSRYADNNELYRVVDGVRQLVAEASGGSFADNAFHQVDIRRRGSLIEVFFDGSSYLTAEDDTFGEGAIGIGSYNDAASFDDISVQPYLPEQPVGGLWVDSTAAGAGLWSLRDNLQQGDVTYADRNYTFISVPAGLQGAQWIRPAADSKTYTGSTLAWFGLLRDADVYVAIDERTSPPPAWLEGWTATGDTLTVDFPPDPAQTIVLDVYRRRFAAGSVSLGNNGSTNQPTYVSIVVPVP